MSHHPPNDNPWQDETSPTGRNEYGSQGHQNTNPYSSYQDPAQTRNSYAQEPHQGQYNPPDHPLPHHQQPLSSHPPDHHHPASNFSEPASNYQPQPNSSVPHQYQSPRDEVPPGLPPRRSATELALPTGQDRSHQIEVMQSYESAGRKDEHDFNVETLQREFPKLDGSLIAAIYGDSKSLSATREMLGELEG